MFQETVPPNSPPAPATPTDVRADSLDFSSFGAVLLSSLARESPDHFCTLVSLNSSHRCNYFLEKPGLGWFSLLEAFFGDDEKNVGLWIFCEVGDDFFVQQFSGNLTREIFGRDVDMFFASTWNSSSSFFRQLSGSPRKKNPLMTSPYDLFFFTILGGVGTMFASFCWEMYDAFNTQRSKLWNYTLLFLSEQQRRLGSCFYALFFVCWSF